MAVQRKKKKSTKIPDCLFETQIALSLIYLVS